MSKWVILMISVVVLILSAAIFYFASQMSVKDNANMYNARKEDLYLSQQRIEQSIAELNQTIAQESQNQKALTDKVNELAVKANSSPPIINTTKYVQEPPTVVRVPTTRAS